MSAFHYLFLVLLAPQVLADIERAKLRRKCAELVTQDKGAQASSKG